MEASPEGSAGGPDIRAAPAEIAPPLAGTCFGADSVHIPADVLPDACSSAAPMPTPRGERQMGIATQALYETILPPTVAQGLLRGDDVRTHYKAATTAFISLDDFKDMDFNPDGVLAELGPVYMHLDAHLAQNYGAHVAKVSSERGNTFGALKNPDAPLRLSIAGQIETIANTYLVVAPGDGCPYHALAAVCFCADVADFFRGKGYRSGSASTLEPLVLASSAAPADSSAFAVMR